LLRFNWDLTPPKTVQVQEQYTCQGDILLILGYITRNRVELTEITQQIFSHSKQFLHSLAPKTPNIYKITAEIGPSGRITSRSFDVWV